MIELITPSITIGWISWEFFRKSITSRDQVILDALTDMIGFRINDTISASFYCGEKTDDGYLQYCHFGAYELRKIEDNATIFYTHEELLVELNKILKAHYYKS
jgi:hypothetical protein